MFCVAYLSGKEKSRDELDLRVYRLYSDDTFRHTPILYSAHTRPSSTQPRAIKH